MRKRNYLMFVLCLCLLFSLSGCRQEKKERQEAKENIEESIEESTEEGKELRTAAEEGCLAPDIALTYLDGSTAKLSDYRGKVVLLNLWATWCGPCVNEMPAFPLLQEEFGEQLQIIALNCGDSADTVQTFAEKNGYDFLMALDEQYDVMLGTYQTSSIPYTVIIDPEGVISHISTGAGTAEQMFEYYKEAIENAF